jgi:hypothetical protein
LKEIRELRKLINNIVIWLYKTKIIALPNNY